MISDVHTYIKVAKLSTIIYARFHVHMALVKCLSITCRIQREEVYNLLYRMIKTDHGETSYNVCSLISRTIVLGEGLEYKQEYKKRRSTQCIVP